MHLFCKPKNFKRVNYYYSIHVYYKISFLCLFCRHPFLEDCGKFCMVKLDQDLRTLLKTCSRSAL